MWLAGRLAPDFKTIANFRKDNGKAIRNVRSQFIVLCRKLNLFSQAVVATEPPSTLHSFELRNAEHGYRRLLCSGHDVAPDAYY
jgi:hypothetical protein